MTHCVPISMKLTVPPSIKQEPSKLNCRVLEFASKYLVLSSILIVYNNNMTFEIFVWFTLNRTNNVSLRSKEIPEIA